MENDYSFWKNYLNQVVNNIEMLLERKKEIYVDLHMHSLYSADSKQTLEEIINRVNNIGIDIISITDHDAIGIYDDLFELINKKKITKPIIIPGVEFTIENDDYGSQFHILQLMINPKDPTIIKDVEHQNKAYWNRINKQFERLYKNKAINYFFKKYNFNCTIEGYKKYLSKIFPIIPEYKTLMDYLQQEFSKRNITNWDILEECKKTNELDICEERKQLKLRVYASLKNKYLNVDNCDYNDRFFHNLLAVRGADDDFFKSYEVVGDLSVNYFGELKLDELNRKNITFFAHPSENRLNLLNELVLLNNNISGMEFNRRCHYSSNELFNNKLKELDMIKIIGSDSHDKENDLYNDKKFYQLDKDNIKRLIINYKKNIDK